MLNSDFENKVRHQMEELKLNASEAVWDNIERELTQDKKPRRWLLYFILLPVLVAVFLFTRDSMSDNPEQIPETKNQSNPAAGHSPAYDRSKTVPIQDIAAQDADTILKTGKNKRYSERISNALAPSNYQDIAPGQNAHVTANSRRAAMVKSEDRLRVTLATAQAGTGEKEPAIALSSPGIQKDIPVKVNADKEVAEHDRGFKPVLRDSGDAAGKLTDSLMTPEMQNSESGVNKGSTSMNDSMGSIPGKSESLQATKKWQYSILAGAGISNIVSGLFQNKTVFADARNNTGSGGGTGSIGTPPNNPSASAAFAAGLQAERSIGKRWKFITGLQYLYHSSSVKTGSRVDSTTNFNMGTGSITANNYYQTGSQHRYKNKSHYFHVPFLVQYAISKKYPVYVEAGPGVSYVISSNVLLYNRSAYFSSPDAYNKLLLSFTAGAGLELNRNTKNSFSIGYRFNYGSSSITKAPLSNQQPQGSMLYLVIPVKK